MLRNQLEREGHNPSELGVPEAKGCTIAKLAGGSLMNDTCNGARSTANKLVECMVAHAKEYYGTTDEEWDQLPKSVREARTYCVDLLCWAHLRNLFIGEGAKEEKAYLKAKLKVSYSLRTDAATDAASHLITLGPEFFSPAGYEP